MYNEYMIHEEYNTDSKDRENIYRKTVDILNKNGIKFKCSKSEVDNFINCKTSDGKEKPDQFLFFSVGEYYADKACKLVNKEIKPYGGCLTEDNYGTIYLSLKEDANTLLTPEEFKPDTNTLLDNTDPKNIWLSSDWHLFQNKYKNERNYVNTQKIVTWCRQNIKNDDVFMYLGDICFRYTNIDDQEKAAKIMNSIPGTKILILGNHDRMLGDEFYTKCGFDYVMEELIWKNYVFTHRPINMQMYPDDYLNIHGHIHNIKTYNTTDGKRNVNVYPLFYGNKPVTLDYLVNHVEELIKDNKYNDNVMLGEQTSRSNLPDDSFGIPKDRKFPLDSERHVKSAIKLFGHAEESKKKQLAERIRDAAKKYDLSIPSNTQCYKYLSEGGIENIIPDEVNTIVFDMGSVLVDCDIFNASYNGLHVSHLLSRTIYNLIEEKVLNNFDLEHYTVDQAKKYFASIAPDNIKPHIDSIFELFRAAMFKFPYTDELIDTLRSKGYMIYYLSNWSKWSYDLLDGFFNPIIKKFDGGLFSFESNYHKPQEEFYKEFFNKYKLDPSKCIFFDDKSENVLAAENVGMKAVLFNSNETPKLLLNDNFNIPSDINNKILVDTGVKLESVDINNITWWHLNSNKNPKYVEKESYYRSIDDAIKYDINDYELLDDNIEKYVYTCNGNNDDFNPIPVGQICINNDGTYQWIVQYPLECNNGMYCTYLKEWSMASCNPIRGICKPFILKFSNDSGSIINTKQYALSPDIISDKYLVVNENSKLEIVDSEYFDDCFVEVYEFVGNKAYLDKLNKAYRTGKTVDNTVFYTMLTGKPMLCEDQIDFDPNFKKIDFDLLKENILTELATIRDGFIESQGINTKSFKIMEAVNTDRFTLINKYNKNGNISVYEDFDGIYLYNNITKKRSSSVKSISTITESMIKSIL